MAELTPQWLQGGSHPANTDRLLTAALVANDGIVGADDLEVTERAAGANMSVDVAAGAIFIAGSESSTQGTYHCYNDAVVNKTIAAADATNPRIDLVIAQVRDSFYSGGDDDWQIDVLTGTPAASPAEPTVPDNAVVLARIDVDASAPSITDADITDRRYQASSPTGLRALTRYSVPGSYPFEKANWPWLRMIRVRVQAGGGGGVGNVSGTNSAGGPGGGGGGYAESVIHVDDLAASETITVGAGGAGSSTGTATEGEASSFGSHVAADGGGPGDQFATGYPGLGGKATAGQVQIEGGDGQPCGDPSTFPTGGIFPGGTGGSSHMGGGGAGMPARASNSGGQNGGAYGGGGGGGFRRNSDVTGGDGADGVVFVELYA